MTIRTSILAAIIVACTLAGRATGAQQHASALAIHGAHQDLIFRENAGFASLLGLPELSATPLRRDESEIRVWLTVDGAAGRTHHVVRVRLDTVRVLGAELFLVGPATADFAAPARARCGERAAVERAADTARVFRCELGAAGSDEARRVLDGIEAHHVRFLREQGEGNGADDESPMAPRERRMLTVEVRDGVAYRAYSYFDVDRDGFGDERQARALADFVRSLAPR